MAGGSYTDATVLLYDRNRAVRKQTRSVLTVIGFKNFMEYGNLEEVRYLLKTRRVDVLVLGIESTDCGVLRLIEDIRRQRCSLDPFVPTLLTAWDARLRAVRPVISSGADDILLHPYSAKQMQQRIDGLIHHRKPFVVSEDYYGPDRRNASDREVDPTSIVVPNSLQAVVTGRREVGPTSARIKNVSADLRRLKLRNMSRQIWSAAHELYELQSSLSYPGRCDKELAKLRKSIVLFAKTLNHSDPADLSTLCDSLIGVLTGLKTNGVDEKGLFLLEQSALALRVAAKLANEDSDAGDAISEAVAKTGRVQANLIRAVMG